MKDHLTQRLHTQPDTLATLMYSLTEDEIRSHPIADKWSIYENLVHLGRYNELFLGRMRQIEAGGTPLFGQYKAEDDPLFYEWQKKSFYDMLTDLYKTRYEVTAYLSSLSGNALLATGKHFLYGTMTVEGWTEVFLLHEAHHFFTIFKLGIQLRPDRILGLC
ncbi:DinB family protein [Danxiaibacter flavus]|uniref:DinB family protein n=1 Tax=Danxiaibacter flavus TaxID=3049108 RepID=A0ABV3ZQL5_9BACT|nr:DinB family protein [Chitinophagaceae bacterium DXS]